MTKVIETNPDGTVDQSKLARLIYNQRFCGVNRLYDFRDNSNKDTEEVHAVGTAHLEAWIDGKANSDCIAVSTGEKSVPINGAIPEQRVRVSDGGESIIACHNGAAYQVHIDEDLYFGGSTRDPKIKEAMKIREKFKNEMEVGEGWEIEGDFCIPLKVEESELPETIKKDQEDMEYVIMLMDKIQEDQLILIFTDLNTHEAILLHLPVITTRLKAPEVRIIVDSIEPLMNEISNKLGRNIQFSIEFS